MSAACMVRSAPLVKIPSKLRGNCEVSAGRDSDGECAGAKRVIVEGESQRRSGPSTSSLFPLIISSVLPHHSFETISLMHLSPRTFALGLKLSGLAKGAACAASCSRDLKEPIVERGIIEKQICGRRLEMMLPGKPTSWASMREASFCSAPPCTSAIGREISGSYKSAS